MKINKTLILIILSILISLLLVQPHSSFASGSSIRMETDGNTELGSVVTLDLTLETPNKLKHFEMTIQYDRSLIDFVSVDSLYFNVISNQNGELKLVSNQSVINEGNHAIARVIFSTQDIGMNRFRILSSSAITSDDVSIGVDASQTVLVMINPTETTSPTPNETTEPTSTTSEFSEETTQETIEATLEETTEIINESTSESETSDESTSEASEPSETTTLVSTENEETSTIQASESTGQGTDQSGNGDIGKGSSLNLYLVGAVLIVLAIAVLITIVILSRKYPGKKRNN